MQHVLFVFLLLEIYKGYAQRDGLLTGRYICSECGGLMEFEDEWEDTLVCPACGHSVDLEHYGMENDEEYDALYPTRDQICDD